MGLAKCMLAENEIQPAAGAQAAWQYKTSSDIMSEINALTPSYAGITYSRLEHGERLQWPVPNSDHPGTPILHIHKFARGVGKFMPLEDIPPAELPDDDYPMLLSTGRVLYHWHGGQMTRRSKGLAAVYNRALIEINPDDAIRMGIKNQDRLQVTSRRGSIQAETWITDRVPPGMVYANFHFPESSANELTIAALDPISKIPEYKVCAVKIELIQSRESH
jgi:formate dehydrogenase major subunit/formate dehydrogenase alpha subunit